METDPDILEAWQILCRSPEPPIAIYEGVPIFVMVDTNEMVT